MSSGCPPRSVNARSVRDAERRAGEAPQTMTIDEGLPLRDSA